MLIFESWPPEAGKVKFTEATESRIKGDTIGTLGDHLNDMYTLGRNVGSLIFANLESPNRGNTKEIVGTIMVDFSLPADTVGEFNIGVDHGISSEQTAAKARSGGQIK